MRNTLDLTVVPRRFSNVPSHRHDCPSTAQRLARRGLAVLGAGGKGEDDEQRDEGAANHSAIEHELSLC